MLTLSLFNIDYYMSPPSPGFDLQYSEFLGSEVKEVPVIRIFGSDKSGEKVCLHVHGYFPYIYIPYDGADNHGRQMYELAANLNNMINTSIGNRNSEKEHLFDIKLVTGIPFYGYHRKECMFLKLLFYNPGIIKKAVELLENGVIKNTVYQPHEAHIPFHLQFMIDHKLHGMSFISVSNATFRRSSETLENFTEDGPVTSNLVKISTCKIEADTVSSFILNQNVSSGQNSVNPGMEAIWKEEQKRRGNDESFRMPSQSSGARTFSSTTSEIYYMDLLTRKLSIVNNEASTSSNLVGNLGKEEILLPAETPADTELLEASCIVCYSSLTPSKNVNCSSKGSSSKCDLDQTSLTSVTSFNSSEMFSPDFDLATELIDLIENRGNFDSCEKVPGSLESKTCSSKTKESIEKEYVDADSLLGAHLTYDDNIHDSDDGQEDVKFLSLTPITDTETYNESCHENRDLPLCISSQSFLMDEESNIPNHQTNDNVPTEDLNEFSPQHNNRESKLVCEMDRDVSIHGDSKACSEKNIPERANVFIKKEEDVLENVENKKIVSHTSPTYFKQEMSLSQSSHIINFKRINEISDSFGSAERNKKKSKDLGLTKSRKGTKKKMKSYKALNIELIQSPKKDKYGKEKEISFTQREISSELVTLPEQLVDPPCTLISDEETQGNSSRLNKMKLGEERNFNLIEICSEENKFQYINLERPENSIKDIETTEPAIQIDENSHKNKSTSFTENIDNNLSITPEALDLDDNESNQSIGILSFYETTFVGGDFTNETRANAELDEISYCEMNETNDETDKESILVVTQTPQALNKIKKISSQSTDGTSSFTSEKFDVALDTSSPFTLMPTVHGTPNTHSDVFKLKRRSKRRLYDSVVQKGAHEPTNRMRGTSNRKLPLIHENSELVSFETDQDSVGEEVSLSQIVQRNYLEEKCCSSAESTSANCIAYVESPSLHRRLLEANLMPKTPPLKSQSSPHVGGGVTPNSSFGFKMSYQNLQNAHVVPQLEGEGFPGELVPKTTLGLQPVPKYLYTTFQWLAPPSSTGRLSTSRRWREQAVEMLCKDTLAQCNYLTLLCVELHITTRGDLRPDPSYDPIQAVFYAVHDDKPGQSESQHNEGIIIVQDTGHEASFLKSTAVSCKAKFVNSELSLLEEIVLLVRQWDPDILAGYEVEMLSWGYLFQRAVNVGMNLCPLVSRIPSSSRGSKFGTSDTADPEMVEFTAEIKLVGRNVLNVWRILRHEVAVMSYSFENMMYHILHERVPQNSFKTLTLWWNHRTHVYRWMTIEHYLLRVKGIIKILIQLDLLGRTTELAKLFGIQFYEVLSRGSQFRVESMMLRLAKPSNYVPVSPNIQQRAKMRAPESLPLIMEPSSKFFTEPVIVLDFQSLYPSMMIAYNYCFSTCLGRVEELGQFGPFKFGCTRLKVNPFHLMKLQGKINISPCGVAFVKDTVRKGILPRMLEEILETRLMVKQSMKENAGDKILQRVLHSRQLGLKLIANVTYGYTSANFSGRMPCIEVGDSVVSKGRETLERAIKLVESTKKWHAKVIYGDTDSLFVLVSGRTREEAFNIGSEIAETVTQDNPKPVKLKLEKVYQPCILQTKKRYVGYKYESSSQQIPEYDAKGIETVRRDGCPVVAKILKKSLCLLFETKDVNVVKRYVQRQFSKLLQDQINFQDLIFAREYRGISGYKPGACVPALELTRTLLKLDRRAEPRVGERVPYVIVNGPPGLPLIRLVRSPYDLLFDPSLRINTVYYITRVIVPPLDRCFALLGADVESWYKELPRKCNTHFPTADSVRHKKSTISQYFSTVNCAVCDEMTQTGICSECQMNPQLCAVVLAQKLWSWERNAANITKICESCYGRPEANSCISLDCPILFKRFEAVKVLKQASFLRNLQRKFLNY